MNKDIRLDKTSPAYLKKTKSGGLFVGFLYVLLFMSILTLGMWQSFESSGVQKMAEIYLKTFNSAWLLSQRKRNMVLPSSKTAILVFC